MKKKFLLISTFTVFLIFTLTLIIVGLISGVLLHTGIIRLDEPTTTRVILLVIEFFVSCLIVGMIISFVVMRIPGKLFNEIINGMDRLASGDYSTRVTVRKHSHFKELELSFNKLATELQNTEMLQKDFTNNFSHEFKTPITSILGFTRLLKKNLLSDEEKREYLDIIEEEMKRLFSMATNILELTKIENQQILTNKNTYNLSEQIRLTVLLLEKKWEAKHIVFNLNFNEYSITANEEMIKQVFINLIDNAIKFSEIGGEIDINIYKKEHLQIIIANGGELITEEQKSKIFRKFYQGDSSHATEGTGIGLAVVKAIIELHGGTIEVQKDKLKNYFIINID